MLPTLIRRSGGLSFDRPLNLLNELDRLLGRSWEEDGDYGVVGAYPVDIHEDEKHVYVDAEMPGFNKEDVDVTLERGVLRITAERKVEQKKKGEAHLAERRFTRVARSFTLPTEVNEGEVDAQLSDGVLHLVLNKHEEVRPKKIQVK